MYITVKEFRNIINQCPDNWTITFKKWEHGTEEDFWSRNHYPYPNVVGVKVQEVTNRHNDLGGTIRQFILEDEFDDELTLKQSDAVNFFTAGLDDYDLLDFVLYTEDTPGHYNHVPLSISVGDKGYSDKVMSIDLDETN